MSPRQRLLLAGCAAPASAFFLAFWLLPVLRLLALPAEKGWGTYFVVLTDGRYMESMLNTVLLSVAVTLATLVIGATVGIYLALTIAVRHLLLWIGARFLFGSRPAAAARPALINRQPGARHG